MNLKNELRVITSLVPDSCMEVYGRFVEKQTVAQHIYVLSPLRENTSESRLIDTMFIPRLCVGKGSCLRCICCLISDIWLDLPQLVTILSAL